MENKDSTITYIYNKENRLLAMKDKQGLLMAPLEHVKRRIF
ncbi:hypothetical protein [Streptococcus acidominimus]|nr:hypothetical protein [Streptococcus acidominimus]